MIPKREKAEADLAAAHQARLDAFLARDALKSRYLEELAAVEEKVAGAEVTLRRARAIEALTKISADALASLRADTPTGPGSGSLVRAGLAERLNRYPTGHYSVHPVGKYPATWTALGTHARTLLAELESTE